MIALIEIPKCCTATNVWRSPSPSAVSRRDCRRAGQAEALSEGSRSAVDGGGGRRRKTRKRSGPGGGGGGRAAGRGRPEAAPGGRRQWGKWREAGVRVEPSLRTCTDRDPYTWLDTDTAKDASFPYGHCRCWFLRQFAGADGLRGHSERRDGA